MKVPMLLASASSSVLTDEVKTAINAGLDSLSATVSDVVMLVIPVSITIIALTAGVRYALKKVRGVISQAA